MSIRSQPFWFWNDTLDKDRLVWQYDQLVDAGTGGACLHARSGLNSTEYLDERWLSAIDAVVERAKERGAIIWLYDELGWPSGTAGGRVPREHPELSSQALQMHDLVVCSPEDLKGLKGNFVASFIVTKSDPLNGFQKRNDGGVTLLPDRVRWEPVQLDNPDALIGKRVLIFQQVRSGGIDYLNPDAAQAFLESTHEVYHSRYKDDFGSTITHIFMDEAGMFARGPGSLPWTGKFVQRFEERRGYSILDRLPDLLFDSQGCEATRFDYWSLATELFREGFGIPLNEWCKEHGITYSGHYVFETTLKEAIKELGSTMPLYEHQGLPGIDILGNDFYSERFELESYGFYLVMLKQASSVCNQLSKGGLLSESHGVGGNAMLPEDFQSVNNFQMALGVTLVCQHAPFYSIRGKRKLDHPPIIGWQNPYWKFAKKHFDTSARTGWLLGQGVRVCDVLLLHPSASMQASFRQVRYRDENKAQNYLLDADMPFELVDKHIALLSIALLDAQIDFEFGDEEIMAEHAAVDNLNFRVGDASYRVVVVPPSVNMRGSTLALLNKFRDNGGSIISVGSAPHLLDGRPSDELVSFFNDQVQRVGNGVDRFDYSNAVAMLTDLSCRTVTLKDANGDDVPSIKVHRRMWDGHEILFLANVSRESVSAVLETEVGVTGCIEEWDHSTGQTSTVAECVEGTTLGLELDWAAKQARMLVAVPGAKAAGQLPAPTTEVQRSQPIWSGKRNDPNLLLLDACQVSIGNEQSGPISVLQAREWVADHGDAEFTIDFTFDLSESNMVRSEMCVASEVGDGSLMTLNGDSLPDEPTGWLFDPVNRIWPLAHVKPGRNILSINLNGDAADLAPPILMGGFRTRTDDNVQFILAADHEVVGIGSWPDSGLHFYTGTVTYSCEVSGDDLPDGGLIELDIAGLKGAAEVRVDGVVVDHVLWPPYSCDLTDHIGAGSHTVEIEVANTLRNIYGSHYCKNEAIKAGIACATYESQIGAPKQFADYGLLSPPEIVVSK